jgi:SHS2 domain-containing protein
MSRVSTGSTAVVEAIDHVADVGLRVRARSLTDLFSGAAAGMMALLTADAAPAPDDAVVQQRVLDGAAPDVAALLVHWLRELLYLRQVHGFVYEGAGFDVLDERRFRAHVRGRFDARPPAREIKGVTYHALDVARDGGDWFAAVILDV